MHPPAARRAEEARAFVPPRFERVLPSKHDIHTATAVLSLQTASVSSSLLMVRLFPCLPFSPGPSRGERSSTLATCITMLPLEHISRVLPCRIVSSNSQRRLCSLLRNGTGLQVEVDGVKSIPTASIGKQLRLLLPIGLPNAEVSRGVDSHRSLFEASFQRSPIGWGDSWLDDGPRAPSPQSLEFPERFSTVRDFAARYELILGSYPASDRQRKSSDDALRTGQRNYALRRSLLAGLQAVKWSF